MHRIRRNQGSCSICIGGKSLMFQNYRILEEVGQSNERCVLATVIQVEGSAYRKEGASMLIKEGGTRIGMLSGGCLESDLLSHSIDIFQEESNRMIVYDMRAK